MKTLISKAAILIAATGIFAIQANAQNVSHEASMRFTTDYSRAHLKNWKMRGDTCVASFKMDDRPYMAYYLSDGTWIKTEREIKHESTLPVSAQYTLKKGAYASWNLDKMELVRTPNTTLYVAYVDNHSGNPNQTEGAGYARDRKLYFNTNGRLVKTERFSM